MTSIGKITIIKQLIGSKVAKTGARETTKEITPYDGRGYRLFDIPSHISAWNKLVSGRD
jgi:hypothetical protein